MAPDSDYYVSGQSFGCTSSLWHWPVSERTYEQHSTFVRSDHHKQVIAVCEFGSMLYSLFAGSTSVKFQSQRMFTRNTYCIPFWIEKPGCRGHDLRDLKQQYLRHLAHDSPF